MRVMKYLIGETHEKLKEVESKYRRMSNMIETICCQVLHYFI